MVLVSKYDADQILVTLELYLKEYDEFLTLTQRFCQARMLAGSNFRVGLCV